MANPAPRSLTDYLQRFEETLHTVQLPCIFCKQICTTHDLTEFVRKNLQIVWRGTRRAFAVCTSCLRATAKYEYSVYYQGSISGDYIEDITGRPIASLVVRCVRCLTELDLSEKLGALFFGLPFMIVRSQWRCYCRDCIVDRV
ncbi:early protein 6 [Callithrix penicillata papillomavirus type 2]|uniref:Protein E6 n=1 Tax=Callithrix penicillata papillomavirus type 2 TaxID=2704504 RepID=A0A6C0T8E2_9PAPI|nr:early protein 6 [Callithrix penicillata papillomavirus type 2]